MGRTGVESCAAEMLPFATHPLQGKLAVVCRADRADLRGLFSRLDVRRTYGKVWLVGAGPGSADLLTLRAQRVMARADVVYCDDLVDESLLSLCGGESIYVGKRKGRASHRQDAINEKLYYSALEGKTVVRLKGGDPSIFGRAGEELEFLRRRCDPRGNGAGDHRRLGGGRRGAFFINTTAGLQFGHFFVCARGRRRPNALS